MEEHVNYNQVVNDTFQDSPQNEKQISVDPVSLKKSSSASQFRDSRGLTQNFALPPSAAKHRFGSISHPNSPATSPRLGSSFFKKLWRSESQDFSANSPLGYMKQGRGKVSGTFDDFDLRGSASVFNNKRSFSSPKVGAVKDVSKSSGKKIKDYKCGSCLYLPSFGKVKPVRAKSFIEDTEHVISARVSMEKFDCQSLASCPLPNDHIEDEHDDPKEFFELPQELIRGGFNDAEAPVKTAFVFGKDPKGILKHDLVRNSSESTSRHVRFLTSCPTSPTACVSPRLQQARDDFNAFLQANPV